MLDVLVDLLIDLIGGKTPQKSAQPRRRTQGAAGSAGSRVQPPTQRDERLEQERQERERIESPGRADQSQPMTLEDVIRRFSGESEPEPLPAPAPVPPPPPPSLRNYSRPVRRAVKPEARSLVAMTLDALPEEEEHTAKRGGNDYVAVLRNNPKAAQDALVYAEIFGRPLAERDTHL